MAISALSTTGAPGRVPGKEPSAFVTNVLTHHDGARGALIAVLDAIQTEYGYLPEVALRAVAGATGRPLVDLYAVATFYRSFSLRPRGRHCIHVCLGTACHVRGAPAVLEELERRLGIRAGETTPDGEFTLETVNCLGACALGPIVAAGGRYFSQVTVAKVKAVLREIRSGRSEVDQPAAATPAG